jgi:type IV pilus assembly protein PilY1
MLVEALTGKRPATSAFDLFGGTSIAPTTTSDRKVDEADLIKLNNGKLVAASGLSLGIGIHKNISVIGNHGYASGSNGGLGQLDLAGSGGGGGGGGGKRVSWRQLR